MTEPRMSSTEKRKNLRRSVTYPAFIDLGDGSPVIECTLCDACQQGALLAVAKPASVPDEFTLVLSSGGAAHRRCRVAWRTKDQVGVEFLKELKTYVPCVQMPAVRSNVPQAADARASTEHAEQVEIDTVKPR